jgi:pimeloyl-ACP methyl ester carboxylesterase
MGETGTRTFERGTPRYYLRPQRVWEVQPTAGYNYDTFAEDLHKLITHLELREFALVGFSMGGGEVARYFGKYGSKGVRKAVIISGVPPFLLKTPDNPEGVDGSVFEGDRESRRRRSLRVLHN